MTPHDTNFVEDYCAYVYASLKHAGVPVIGVHRNLFDKSFEFALRVCCKAPHEQFNRSVRPGTWSHTVKRGETVHDVIFAYHRSYSQGEPL